MTRHFYTDPLAAAWMAKHFGMRHAFYDERSDLREYQYPITGEADEWRSDRGRFYVHPESLHLLEPRVGDVCLVTEEEEADYYTELFDLDLVARGVHRVKRIIQRNGVAFHWPQQEAA